jgi:hypothetical protein
MPRQRIVICPDGHLFRTERQGGSVGDVLDVRCPRCRRLVSVRVVDARMLSEDALAEAWQHSAEPPRSGRRRG